MIIRTDSLEIFKQNEYTLTDIGYVSNNAYLSIVATNKCQRNCFYCINSHTDKTLELPIDKAIKNIKRAVEKYHIREAVILGGEPLMHSDILELCHRVKRAGIRKLFLTTNGIKLSNNDLLIDGLSDYLAGINISYHNDDFITFAELERIYREFHEHGVKVRINTNIWRGNHDTFDSMTKFVRMLTRDSFLQVCDEVRVSNLIPKDSFSVNDINNDTSRILSNEEYENLFTKYLAFEGMTNAIFVNPKALGFVRYYLIPSTVPVILNWNIGSTVSDQVCENDVENRQINTFKCLVNGEISLSWNTNNVLKLD